MNSYSYFKHLHAIHLSHRSTILQLNYIHKRYGLSSLVFCAIRQEINRCMCICASVCAWLLYILPRIYCFRSTFTKTSNGSGERLKHVCVIIPLFCTLVYHCLFTWYKFRFYTEAFNDNPDLCYSGTLKWFHAINNKLISYTLCASDTKSWKQWMLMEEPFNSCHLKITHPFEMV